jgi:phosphate transport system ATP-binding protein
MTNLGPDPAMNDIQSAPSQRISVATQGRGALAPSPVKIAVRDLDFHYDRFLALKKINMDIPEKRVTAMIGPSGCGKSTLLRIFNRIYALYPKQEASGEILLDGENILSPKYPMNRLRSKVGMVFQKPVPFPMTIYENVAYAIRHHEKLSKKQLDERVELALRQGALWDEVKDKLGQSALGLSGGQQQRLCIARTLAVEPEVILMDEPASALDPVSTQKIEDTMADLKQSYTVVIVTHDPEEALLMADDLALMARGRILQTGSPADCYLRPSSIEAARMLGETNVLSARVEAGRAITAFGALPAENIAEGEAQVMVRPEGLRLDPQGVPVEVVRVRFGGPFHEVTITAGGNEATLRFASGPVPDKGPARVSIDPERAIVFPGR